MTQRARLARNTLWNLFGTAAPVLAALVATPFLVSGFGTERFGVLTVVWGMIGYFTIFDLGLGRALTQTVAARLGDGREEEIPAVVWTALAMMVALGLLAGAGLALLAEPLAAGVLRIPPELRAETHGSFLLLALALPLVTSGAGMRGVLEAHQEFRLVNAIRVPLGLLTFLGPLVFLPFTASLIPATAVLVAGRFAAWVAQSWLCLRVVMRLRDGRAVRRSLVVPLLRFGGWMTVCNVASSLMVYLDRFVIGATLSMSAVAFYVTPYEMASRVGTIPAALLMSVFPALATGFARDRERTAILFHGTLRAVFLIVFPLTLALVALAPEGLTLWLGPEFSRQGAIVLQWIAVGVYLNSLAMVAATGLQGVGRPDLAGWVNLLELPFYLGLLWILLGAYGIAGAAAAWALRMAVDATLLLVLARRVEVCSPVTLRWSGAMMAGGAASFWMAALIDGLLPRGVLLVATAIAFGVLAWTRVLQPAERAALLAVTSSWRRGA